ncbi:MAG: type I DNA topoisomerase [bacterium]|nr:type I DNA topoisomerase [bacterium]MBU1917025.1 type I DNA topoisomerase [bacterium]
MSILVIVESPTKAKTIKKFLPKGYYVTSCLGHIRDLPKSAKEIPATHKSKEWTKLGVDVDNNFQPFYLIPKTKKKVVKELKEKLKESEELILATDEDREGESISWHLQEVLKPTIPTKRMVFHEITKEAIIEAINNCREIDDRLVRAQETRRILDRLVGYTLSPLLWKKIAYGLSAGRVQSVAIRVIVMREIERRNFHKGTYWDLKALLNHKEQDFESIMVSYNGKRLATGKDFDENTGQIQEGKDVLLLGEKQAKEIQENISKLPWSVKTIDEKPSIRRPYPPFITSTLQQEANRKLRLPARQTMQLAQRLYEQGFITYMRTDSVHLSNQAITASRNCVTSLYGKNYLSPEPRHFKSKSKNAQEAHEAIRPAGNEFQTPKETGLSGKELALYELIWKRTVATQMADAQLTFISADIEVNDCIFRSSGKRIDFAGFFRAYVEGSDDPDAAIDSQEISLPSLAVGDKPKCQGIESLSHETQPPARYTEASLVKKLEQEGIGRPSTYATILSTIMDRGYVLMKGNALQPTFMAFAVVHLLENHFPHLVDLGFTADMENTLDDIATGDAEWLPYLKKFYLGADGLKTQVEAHEKEIDPDKARSINLSDLDVNVRIGRFGAYLEFEKDGEIVKATIPETVAPADLDMTKIEQILKQKEEGPQILGKHPETDQPVFVLDGRYGPYVQLGDASEEKTKLKRVSLPKGMKPEDVKFDYALGLLSLPKTLGYHPETEKRIFSNIGRFGPFICYDQGKDGKDYRSLKKTDGDDPTTITLERALELLSQPKKTRGRAKAKPIKDLGQHPDDNEPVSIYDGPYGPYIKHKRTNAAIPKDMDPQTIILAQALEWLETKQNVKKKGRKKN